MPGLRVAITALLLMSGARAEATIYWAAPDGSNTAACPAVSGTSDPGVYATIGRAANCATAPGDTVQVKGNRGAYFGNGHRIKTDEETIGFASGTSEAIRTTITGVPYEPRPIINVSNWFTTYAGSLSSRRDYIAIKDLIISGDCQAQGRYCDKGGPHHPQQHIRYHGNGRQRLCHLCDRLRHDIREQ
jgi:hypothetical protein